jgi:hypothetical protein
VRFLTIPNEHDHAYDVLLDMQNGRHVLCMLSVYTQTCRQRSMRARSVHSARTDRLSISMGSIGHAPWV